MDRGLTGERQPGSKGCFGRRRCCALWFVLLLLLGGCEFQRQSPPEVSGSDDLRANAAAEVEAMLLASAASWNGGDLDGFLDDYRRSEDLTFSGASGVTRGWEGVEARYRESYWAPGTVRDSLRFEGIEVVPLGEEHALALGQYLLFRPEEGGVVTSSGFFSLVLERVGTDWKILHDHTSATPEGG